MKEKGYSTIGWITIFTTDLREKKTEKWCLSWPSVWRQGVCSSIRDVEMWPNQVSLLKDCYGKYQQSSDSWHDLPLSGERTAERLPAEEQRSSGEPASELVWPLTASRTAGLSAHWLSGSLQLLVAFIQLSVLGWVLLSTVIQVRLE